MKNNEKTELLDKMRDYLFNVNCEYHEATGLACAFCKQTDVCIPSCIMARFIHFLLHEEASKASQEEQCQEPKIVNTNKQLNTPITPSHYQSDLVMRIVEKFELCSALGNVIKYILRHRNKAGVEDLEKAKLYLERAIAQANGEDIIGELE